MYKIKTPNERYNGETYGVTFFNGQGETENEEVKNVLVNDFGYELVKKEAVKAKSPTTKKSTSQSK
ncbi:hypothetical protein [Halalkalibacter sp. APA_J-10(15)]|uniref:hypothetical protein n=1 Tax=Halalkalibacter sp. APA_J-10(15) TaxID=2933805 RepID=UPI001FF2550A|nr:hypothetical protein [Halalkalibacter sp. APA_J-10(15)]MCK0470887.1 hypothetical protein [Halalkalibacter sp. APA_J-10(15)]